MIQNFDGVKKQLQELAGVLNSFKSEAVQLRLIELIFQGTEVIGEGEDKEHLRPKPAKRKVVKAAKKQGAAKGKRSAKAGRAGPATTITQLIEEGFFKSKRTINDIIEHARKKKARKFKANELSGPLARFVRDGRLDRDRNKDQQYEYCKK